MEAVAIGLHALQNIRQSRLVGKSASKRVDACIARIGRVAPRSRHRRVVCGLLLSQHLVHVIEALVHHRRQGQRKSTNGVRARTHLLVSFRHGSFQRVKLLHDCDVHSGFCGQRVLCHWTGVSEFGRRATPRPIGVHDGRRAVVVLVTKGQLVMLAHADATEADDAQHGRPRCPISKIQSRRRIVNDAHGRSHRSFLMYNSYRQKYFQHSTPKNKFWILFQQNSPRTRPSADPARHDPQKPTPSATKIFGEPRRGWKKKVGQGVEKFQTCPRCQLRPQMCPHRKKSKKHACHL